MVSRFRALKPNQVFYGALIASLLAHLFFIFQGNLFPYSNNQQSDSVLLVKLIPIREVARGSRINKIKTIKKNSTPSSSIISEEAKLFGESSKGQEFNLPPSNLLTYATFVNNNPNQPVDILWKQNDGSYQIQASLSFPFVGKFSFNSVGKIDNYGLAPDSYEELRGNRQPRKVSFLRDMGIISYSNSKETSELPKGVQDRFSILFQLAGLVSGNPSVDSEGVARDIPIADVDRMDHWIFISQGDKQVSYPIRMNNPSVVDVSEMSYKVRHFLRQPRDLGDNRRLEVWLSEDHSWLPVKFLQTEPNGTTIEFFLIKKQPL